MPGIARRTVTARRLVGDGPLVRYSGGRAMPVSEWQS